MYRTW